MSHGRFYTYRLPTVTIMTKLRLVEYLKKTRPDIPIVEISAQTATDEEIKRSLNNAEILFGDPECIAPYWSELKNVRWVQSTWAGNDFLFRALTPDGASKPTPPSFAGDRSLVTFIWLLEICPGSIPPSVRSLLALLQTTHYCPRLVHAL